MSDLMNVREVLLTIEGMTCEHCARSIDARLGAVPGVRESHTDQGAGRAKVVATHEADSNTLAAAVEGAGFRVVGREERIASGGAPSVRRGDRLDLLVLGGGSAGFAAALRAADLGASVAIVERGALGGTCVNVGCVPSKTLIRAAEAKHQAEHSAFDGLRTRVESFDFATVVAQKAELVTALQRAKYWDVLAAYPTVRLIRGTARFRADGTVEVDGQPVAAPKVIIATGASPWAAPIPGLDRVSYLTSTTLMELTSLPASLIAIGGGAIGVELAQAFARFGTKVTILEALPRLVTAEDEDLSAALEASLAAEGIEVRTGAAIREVGGAPGRYRVLIEDSEGTQAFEAEQLLVATGRRANTTSLRLAEAGISLGKKGEVLVDEQLRTSRPEVFAAGDVIGDPAFVYVAAYAGGLAAENALRESGRRFDLNLVPRVTFTDPALASVGLTESAARAAGHEIIVSKLPMTHVPRAIAARDTRGLVKLVADAKTRRFLGAHILAPEAGDIVQEAVMAMRFGVGIEELGAMMHPYLTSAEAIKLAAQTFEKDVAKLSCCA
ncbi:MAG: mercury(II) reductase [Deltaproteobacteria bacterium]|jgi:mercuric reductase|nr:mercury(II) reductase [Deltaproteobacteria bacterium]